MNERSARYVFISLATLAVAALFILFLFDPTTHTFYPQCMLHKITGWYCPGCGVLRATHELLHGNVAKAFSFNAMFVVSLPLVLAYGVNWWLRKRSGKAGILMLQLAWIWAGACAIVVFGVLRNLPYAMFAWMRP